MIGKIQTNNVRVDGILPFNESSSKDSSVTSERLPKKHKGMLPADVARLNLEKTKETVLKEKAKALLNEMKTAVEKSGFDPRVTNILMLYIAFAQNQMDQNDKLQAGWMDQQHVQNLLLEDSAKEQKKIANESTEGKHVSIWKAMLIGLGVLALVLLACTGVGLLIEMAALTTFAVAAGITTVAVGTPTLIASSNPDAPGVGLLTETGPDQAKLTQIGILNSFYNMLAQKANQNIQTGTQLNIVNTSSSNTQQGQQASQIIGEWGQMTRFQVAR